MTSGNEWNMISKTLLHKQMKPKEVCYKPPSCLLSTQLP